MEGCIRHKMPYVFVYWKSQTGTLANSAETAAFCEGLHCLLRLKQPSGTEKHNLETSTCDSFKNKMSNPILNISISMGKFIRIQKG